MSKVPHSLTLVVVLTVVVARTCSQGVPSLYGWAEPEPAMTLSTSLAGGAVLCDGAPNLSFWTHVQPAPGPITLPYNRLQQTLDRTAYYITWQTNEVRPAPSSSFLPPPLLGPGGAPLVYPPPSLHSHPCTHAHTHAYCTGGHAEDHGGLAGWCRVVHMEAPHG